MKTYTSKDNTIASLFFENQYEFLHQYLDRSMVENNIYLVMVANYFALL